MSSLTQPGRPILNDIQELISNGRKDPIFELQIVILWLTSVPTPLGGSPLFSGPTAFKLVSVQDIPSWYVHALNVSVIDKRIGLSS